MTDQTNDQPLQPPVSTGDGGTADLNKELARLEAQIRGLQGKIDEDTAALRKRLEELLKERDKSAPVTASAEEIRRAVEAAGLSPDDPLVAAEVLSRQWNSAAEAELAAHRLAKRIKTPTPADKPPEPAPASHDDEKALLAEYERELAEHRKRGGSLMELVKLKQSFRQRGLPVY